MGQKMAEEKDINKVVEEKYKPIPYGGLKLFAGLLVLVFYILVVCVCYENRDVKGDQAVISGAMSALSLTAFVGFIVFGLRRALKWLKSYWRKNVVGYTIAHMYCAHEGNIWSEITSRSGHKRFEAFPPDYNHSRDCKREAHYKLFVVMISIPLGGWLNGRIRLYHPDSSYWRSSGGIKKIGFSYSRKNYLAYPRLQVYDSFGDRVACSLEDTFRHIGKGGSMHGWWNRVIKLLISEDQVKDLRGKHFDVTEENRNSKNLNYEMFQFINGVNKQIKHSARLGHTQEGLALRADILINMIRFLHQEAGLLKTIAEDSFVKELAEVGEKLAQKKDVNNKRKQRKKEKKAEEASQ